MSGEREGGAHEVALRVSNLTRRFGDHVAVDDVSFDVGAGELVALVGASGSGKTTTLRMIAGYELPDAGRVMAGGRDITGDTPEQRGFGMVFQHYALFPHMSVAGNVGFGLEARGVAKSVRKESVRAALDSVGLAGKAERGIQSLSGGEQQRVALARALVIQPRALLLDEPLSNLDPTLRKSTRDELRAMLRRAGVPALFVTHDQDDAFAVADRVVLLSSGQVLQIGTPEQLYLNPASRAVASFIGRSTIVPAEDMGSTARITIGGVVREVPLVRPEGGPDGDSARMENAVAVLRPEGLKLVSNEHDGSWPGHVVSRRFAGATSIYHVRLSESLVVEITSVRDDAREGDSVRVALTPRPVPIVPA